MINNTNQQLLENLRAGKEEFLIQIYRDHRTPFIQWAQRHFSVSSSDAEDVFQNVMIIFYRNLQSGKLMELTASLRTYLFAIGKRLLLNKLRSKRQDIDLEEVNVKDLDLTIYHQIESTHQQTLIAQAMAKLGAACQKLLRLFFFKNYTSEAVAYRMDLSNSDSARSRKLQCIKQLRKIFQQYERA